MKREGSIERKNCKKKERKKIRKRMGKYGKKIERGLLEKEEQRVERRRN
jgi:hypothetical protein